MNSIEIKAVIKETPQGVLLQPITHADSVALKLFTDASQKKYVTVHFRSVTANKSYMQIKTAWALITLIFKSMYFRKPTKNELEELHDELLEQYADKKPSLLHPDKMVPVTLREMTKKQMSSFIQSLINEISESCELENEDQISARELFCEWESYLSDQDDDPSDYDEDGNMLPLDVWREQHKVSFATGLAATEEMQLDLAHIVTRGSDEAHRDCCWNTMMLTHEEHMKQHEIGWDNFLKLYPHLRGRVRRARLKAGKLALQET